MSSDADLNSVIVADNDLSLRSVLRSLLVEHGFSVLLAADGLEAVDFALSTLARLMIHDKRMPNLDGLQACAQIRRLPAYAEVPIVILTAYDDATTRAAAVRAGATAFFAKPFTPFRLLQGIAPLLGIPPIEDPGSFIWKLRGEPPPAYGEAAELSQGRKVLNVYRRGGTMSTKPSRSSDRLR
jgi:CheY-like chemotaxis protein